MSHRGPDDAGLFHKENQKLNVILGHKRLSIIDLTLDQNSHFIMIIQF